VSTLRSRRLVSVLFLDLVGWTRLAEHLDPEPLQQLLERYYEFCVTAVEERGGVIEKFIGDAVMAVFGAERSQEDDAQRALHTAARIREQVTGLRASRDEPLDVHCGIAAGEALVTQSPRAGLRVVGDVVNLAARLQSAAPAGETYVNEMVVRLVRSGLVLEPVDPLVLKGKRKPVPTWRVAGMVGATTTSAPAIALVDRHDEVRLLVQAYREVVASGSLRVLTMTGLPGVGKSRLVRDTVEQLGSDGAMPRTAFGACPSYGARNSYAALGQILEALGERSGTGTVARNPRVVAVLSHMWPGPARVNGSVEPGVEEISWAVRELLASVATHPLVLVWDDLQWARPVLLDLIGELVESLRDHPVLMVCLARPELANHRLAWLRQSGTVLTLEPLARTETVALVQALAVSYASIPEVSVHSADLLDRVADESAGNPLFAEVMMEAVASGQSLDDVPPSVTAMVGAMIDRLPAAAQRSLEAAAVIGTAFSLEHVRRLHPTLDMENVREMEQRRLLCAGSELDSYHFVQKVVHEVAYRRLGKNQRLTWHRQLADDGVEPAFHLQAAVRLMLDLDPDSPELADLAGRAAEALLQEGTDALRRRDLPSAVALLEQAEEVASHYDEHCRAVAAVRLSDALILTGDLQRALAVVRAVADAALEQPVRLLCELQGLLLGQRAGQACEVVLDELLARMHEQAAGELAWSRFHQLRMLSYLAEGRFAAAAEAVDAALEPARAMRDAYEEERLLVARCEINQWSPTPISTKLTDCVELADRFAGDRYLLVPVLAAKARLRALTGDLDGAWAALTEAQAAVDELRLRMGGVLVAQVTGLVHALCGEAVSAERHYRLAVRLLEDAGYRPAALTMRVLAVRERVGRDEAAAVSDELRTLVSQLDTMDLRGRTLCRATQARMAGAEGDEVTTAAGQVLRLVETTDDLCLRGDAFFDLARAYRSNGDDERASALAVAALASYESVGATLPMRRVREWM
jgi:class 3 adenylate cyclase/tetratricopeptide (TPR) repeat protein